MRTFFQDLRFSMRNLSGSPGFALVVVLTLAIGIASTTTVFTWIDALLLHPIAGAGRSDELAILEMRIPSAPNGGNNVSWLDYTDYRDHLKLLSGLVLYRNATFGLGEGDGARLAWGELVSSNYFEVLGIQPVLGHMLIRTESSDTQGAYPAVVISERLWRSYFRADPKVVGKTVRLNRHGLTIVGVAPARFRGTMVAWLMDLWVPASMGAELGLVGSAAFRDRSYRDFNGMVARRKPGVPMEQAKGEVAALAASLAGAYPNTNRGVSSALVPFWEAHNGVNELLLSPLRILMAVSVLLLLIVCSNVANLLLARSVGRHREFGIRIALGASRWRVARQLMTEVLLLAAAASALGLVLLTWLAGSLVSLVPSVGLPLARDLDLNGRILGFTALCCVASALAAGAAPALLSFRTDLNDVLKEGGRGGSAGVASQRLRGLLVITEVALAAVALVGAGLFTRSFRNAQAIRPGIDTANVLFGRFFLESSAYSGEQARQFAFRLRQRLENSPGIEAVSYTDFVPLSTTAGPYDDVRPEGYTRARAESPNVNRALVAPGYFGVVRTPILEGRDFTEQDDRKTQPVMIVNEAFAHRYFRGGNPVGRRVRLFDKWFAVVGLARDSKYFSPSEPFMPFFWVPFRQFYSGSRELYFLIRTNRSTTQAIRTLRRAVMETDPSAAGFHAVALGEYTQIAVFSQKVAASLMGTMGLMCLLVAALGLYSVMSYSVSQRTQEIGIRMAMGAEPADVVGMVVRQGMGLAFTGLAAGVAVALAASRLIANMLIQVNAGDPITFGAATMFLSLVALVATWLPARRATRIEPMTALRQQ